MIMDTRRETGTSLSHGESAACAMLDAAREHEREGCLEAAIDGYDAAIAAADRAGDQRTVAEGLRALAIARHRMNDSVVARQFGHRSRLVAERLGDEVLVARALNTLAAFDLSDGRLDDARLGFSAALPLAGRDLSLGGRIHQNLGIIANITGDFPVALSCYEAALSAFELAGDDRGCAMVHNSFGQLSADQRRWDDAEQHFARSLECTSRLGEVHLRGQALISQTEVQIQRGALEDARRNAEEALGIFDQLDATKDKADAYRVLGVVYHAMGRSTLAEARFKSAIRLARQVGAVLEEGEALRELGRCYGDQGRVQDAVLVLERSLRSFTHLDARIDMADVQSRLETLQRAHSATT